MPHRPLFKVWSHTGWFAARRDDALILAIRGTEPPNLLNWATNLAVVPVAASGFFPGAAGRVHQGFAEALAAIWPSVEARLRDFTSNGGRKVWITGHSLGGALALLVAARMAMDNSGANMGQLAGLYTCGQPRVGDPQFIDSAMARLGNRYFRIVHGSDIVPHALPEFLKPTVIKKVGAFFGKLFGVGAPAADYAHGGTLQFVPAERGELADSVPPGFPNSLEAVAARMAPVFLLLPGLLIAGRETLPRLPADILHHFPQGTTVQQTAYVSRLRSLLAAKNT